MPLVLQAPRVANLQALELADTALHGTLEDLLLAAPASLTSLELSNFTYRGARGGGALASEDEAAQPPPGGGGWPASPRAWGRLARLERLKLHFVLANWYEPSRGGLLRHEASQLIWFPANVSMLTSLLDLSGDFVVCVPDAGAGPSAELLLPAGLTRLELEIRLEGECQKPPVYMLKGPAALAHASLDYIEYIRHGVSWDLSHVELGALTSLNLRTWLADPVPAWLAKCTALRELRLEQALHRYAWHASDAGPILAPGALAGLGSLELLEVRERYDCRFLRLAGREALQPFTAPGSTACFPAAMPHSGRSL